MRGIISSQVSPGARTCIIVGALEGVDGISLRTYETILWFTRETAPWPSRFGVDAQKIRLETVVPFEAARAVGALDRLIVRDSLHAPSVFLTDEVGGAGAAVFLPVVEAILGQVQSHQRARATRQADGFLWQSNLLANLPMYVRRRVPPAWAGALNGIPAFICGAGPSLDAAIGKLAEIAPAGVVFAADSALRGLEQRGIEVDFSLSVDARKLPVKCLPASGRQPARLVLAGKSPPAWRQAVEESRQYFLSGSQLTEDWLATGGVGKTAVAVHENCGITGLELALHLGCSPICLFGMDHAVDSKEPTRWHHQNLDASLRRTDLEVGRNLAMVPGNYQEEIATLIYWEWRKLDARCAGLPADLVFNVTDRGARLRNTTVVLPEAFSLGSGRGEKAARLAQLGPPEAVDAGVTEKLFKAMRTAAELAEPVVDRAGQALRKGELDRATRLLAGAFRDPVFSRLMGNYCLKIFPHLNQPDSGDATLWATLIEECRGLVALAKSLH